MAGPNPGADLLFGTLFNDSIFGFAGNDVLTGLAGDDLLNGGNNGDILNGGRDNDTLNAGKGNDILIGSSTRGVGEQDSFTGGAGRDKFVLGTAAQVLYDDGSATTAGRNDYALIADFSTSTDVIQLKGQRSDYVLAASPGGLPKGTAIYRLKPGSQPDELIGIIRDRTGLSLNNSYFSFVGTSSFNLANLNGRNGFVLKGDYSGSSVSNAGDVNGDGFDDLLIGAPSASASGFAAGQSYVVFGQAGGFTASLNLANLNGRNGFVLKGIDPGDNSGRSVSNAGDVNGDGFDDLLIGTRNDDDDSRYAGESYVVFGKAGGFNPSLNLSALNGRNGFVLKDTDEILFVGRSVSTAGDINGDGFDDLLIGANGAPYAYREDLPDQSYVVFGKAGGFTANLNLSDLDGSNGFVVKGSNGSGSPTNSVSTAGDVNGDGFDDVIVGANQGGSYYAGNSFVVFGKAGGFTANLNLSDLDGRNGFVLSGAERYDYSGSSVSTAGDVNGDGFDDLVIGGAEDRDGSYAGKSYVVFGKAGGFDPSFNLSALNGRNGFVLNGIDGYDYSGRSVSTAGDVNGDGFDDLLIGATGADPNGINAGESYVVFGKAGGFGASLNLSALNGRNGFVLNGIDEFDSTGSSVSTAGDVNGDGFDDLLIGATGAAPNGESYVVFGRDFTGQVTRLGTAGNDIITGTASDDILIGGLGNDTLLGGRGSDVLLGGGGDDILAFGPIDRRLNGGSGRDTLRIDVSGINLDLSTPASNQLMEFETIDLTGRGNNSLSLRRLDVLDLSDTTNRLVVNGNLGDKVTSVEQGWIFGGTTTLEDSLYNRYTVGAARLLVDTDISQTIT